MVISGCHNMLLLIEVVFPERTFIGIGEISALAIETLKQMRARFILLGLEPRWINFIVSLATPCKLLVVLS